MDPNATLAAIRELIGMALATDDEVDTGHAVNALEYFRDLDEWLSNGGFLPLGWVRAKPAERDISWRGE